MKNRLMVALLLIAAFFEAGVAFAFDVESDIMSPSVWFASAGINQPLTVADGMPSTMQRRRRRRRPRRRVRARGNIIGSPDSGPANQAPPEPMPEMEAAPAPVAAPPAPPSPIMDAPGGAAPKRAEPRIKPPTVQIKPPTE